MIERTKSAPFLPKNWETFLIADQLYLGKMRFLNECNDNKMCNISNIQKNENEKIEAKLNELKRYPPNRFAYMFPSLK